MDYSFLVPNMTCKHCQMTIEQALKKVPGIKKVEVYLDEKLVKVDGDIDENKIIKQIEKAGYNVERKKSDYKWERASARDYQARKGFPT